MPAVGTAAATGPLDAMYDFVLIRAANNSETNAEGPVETKYVLACIIVVRNPLFVRVLVQLRDRDAADRHKSQQLLHAVVYSPDETDGPGWRTLHAAFGDFLH